MKYFLIDKVTAIEPGHSVSGIKCVTYADEVLHDHFPGHPIMPGALIVESMAQLAGLLCEVTLNREETTEIQRSVLAQIDKMKFYKMSGPGDRLDIVAKMDLMHEDAMQIQVEASCDGEVRVKGRLTMAMLKIDSPVITEQRRQTYRIWTRDIKNPPLLR